MSRKLSERNGYVTYSQDTVAHSNHPAAAAAAAVMLAWPVKNGRRG